MLRNLKTLGRALIFLAILLALFALAETFSSSFEACVGKEMVNESQQAAKEHHGPVSIGFSIRVRSRCTVGFIKSHSGEITALATLIMAVFTGTLWWSAAGQYDLLDEQIKDSRILQRAFISVEPGGIRPFEGGEENRLACDVLIHNAGNLPATHVAWFLDKKYSKDSAEKVFCIGTPVGDIVIAPHVKARKGTKPTDKAAFDQMRIGAEEDRAWLYIFGRVTYHDGFKPNRHIDFCHRYNLRGASGYEIQEDKSRYHEHGNYTDKGVEDRRPVRAILKRLTQ